MFVMSITVIAFKVWPVHHQNASRHISFLARALLSLGDKPPAALNAPRVLQSSVLQRHLLADHERHPPTSSSGPGEQESVR